jgi:predicted nucleic acid-binding protein
MILVVDANVLFSALYDMDSNAGRLLLRAIAGDVKLYSTEHVMVEMLDILVRKLDYSEDDVDEAVKALPIEWVDTEIYSEELNAAKKVLKDEYDASLLACAALLGCDVVTGDKAVLAAKFANVRVRRLKDAG